MSYRTLLIGLVTSLLLLVGIGHSGHAYASQDFLDPDQAFILTAESTSGKLGEVRLHWTIAPGYYLYRDRIQISTTPTGHFAPLTKPPGQRKDDKQFGVVDVYHGEVTILVRVRDADEIAVTYQGCAEAGLCYVPETKRIPIRQHTGLMNRPVRLAASGLLIKASFAEAMSVGVSGPGERPHVRRTTASVSLSDSSDSHINAVIGSHSLWVTMPLFFLLGIGLAFTPCVLPMVPIVSGVVVGAKARGSRAVFLTLAFVVPMALTYAGLGAVTAIAGANLQAILQTPWVIFSFAAVFVVLALASFGAFTLQLPEGLRNSLDEASRRRQGGTLAGAAALGLLSALLVGPCMTAPLAGTLLYIAQTGNIATGSLLLLALGLGMGVPLIVVTTIGARYLPKPGAWMDIVKGAFGFVLLATAIWMAERAVSEVTALLLWGALLVSLAFTLFHITRSGERFGLIARSVGLIAGLWGGAMVMGAAAGASNPYQPLAFIAARPPTIAAPVAKQETSDVAFETVTESKTLQARLDAARAAHLPVLVDFAADWCVSCKVVDKEVLSNPQVQHALVGVTLLRVDVTAGNDDQRGMMRMYKVIGPPTVLLFDAAGQERRDARLVGEFGVSDLLQRRPNPVNQTNS